MNPYSHADRVHRLVKEALDRGAAASLEEAEAMFLRYRLVLEIGPAEAHLEIHQAALLTAVALARRVFLGGVFVRLNDDVLRRAPLPLSPGLRASIEQLGGRLLDTDDANDLPRIVIGGVPRRRAAHFEIRTVTRGWRGGIVPVESQETGDDCAMPLTAMLAAAFAVSEAFLHVREENAAAGHRAIGLSLWSPDHDVDWLMPASDEPALHFLPSRLWILGLGHLGQAYLWALGLLPFADSRDLELVLQDVDTITPSTESTSVLSEVAMIGRKKTRLMAAWAESRGFSTVIQERRFAAGFRRHEDEPAILLCGLDNALGRRALDEAGFELVVEAGLGRGYQDFRTLRLHTLPGSRSAAQLWPHVAGAAPATDAPGYTKLLADGVLDRCGMTLLAGKAVGAPFVGAVAASLVVSEVLKLLHGRQLTQLIDLDLQWPEHREVVTQRRDFTRVNPGYLHAAA